MPSQRTPLRDVDDNRRYRGPKLTSYERRKIYSATIARFSPAEIQDTLGHLRDAIRHAIKMDNIRSNGESLPQADAPFIYDD